MVTGIACSHFVFKSQFIREIKVKFDKRNAMHRASTSHRRRRCEGEGDRREDKVTKTTIKIGAVEGLPHQHANQT